MDFELSDEQQMLQDTAYRFAMNEFTPISKICDREEKFSKEVWQKACSAGLVGCFIPEQYGGAGFGFLEYALITEQLCRVDLGLAVSSIGSTFGSENILLFGTEEQKAKYLPLLTKGKAISAGAYTEPDAGSDVAALRTTAVRNGDEYIINGSKMFITNGTICDWMIVYCLTNPTSEKKTKRHSLILVESDRNGIVRNKIYGKMGIRASDTAEIVFEDVRVPCSNLIGEENNAFYYLMHFFDSTRPIVASEGVGLAQGALDKTVKYVKERNVFGKPISYNQGVQFQLAEMATKIEAARNLTYKAAWSLDQGKADPSLNAMAKYFAGEVAVWVCDKALGLHGGYGYIDEYDVQRYYRDAKILEIYEGVKEIEKVTIARRMI